MSFVERQIVVTITLQTKQGAPAKGVAADPNPTFSGPNTNTVTIKGGGTAAQNGLRISAKITRAGAPGFGEASIQIFNLPLNIINKVSTLGVPFIFMVGTNTITIEAGDANATPTKIFSGTINQAWADYQAGSDSIFNITAQSLNFFGVAPGEARGYNGDRAASDLFASVASQAGLTLVNRLGSTNPILSNQYLSGSIRDQIRNLAQAAGVSWVVDDVKNQLIIWPKNGSNTPPDAKIPIIAPPPHGCLVGYPGYTQNGVKATIEFNSDIVYGSTVRIQGSQLEAANGDWVVYYLDYDLECQNPGGPWFTNLELGKPGFAILPQQSAP